MIAKLMYSLSIAWLVLSAPAIAQDKSTIEALNMHFSAAFNRGDFAAAASQYTDDAYLLPPGADTVKGRHNIQLFFTKAGEPRGY
jgi:ketosteroid isomerase-like protein